MDETIPGHAIHMASKQLGLAPDQKKANLSRAHARRVWTTHGEIPEDKLNKTLLGTGLFDQEKAQGSAGWIKELMGEHTPETEEYGMRSVVFRSKKPFHPVRLMELLNGMGDMDLLSLNKGADFEEQYPLRNVIRSKGAVWIANLSGFVMMWHGVGKNLTLIPQQPFKAAIEDALIKAKRLGDHMNPALSGQIEAAQKRRVTDLWGDRQTALVLIGPYLDKEKIAKAVTNALVTDEEFAEASLQKRMGLRNPNNDEYELFRSYKDVFGNKAEFLEVSPPPGAIEVSIREWDSEKEEG